MRGRDAEGGGAAAERAGAAECATGDGWWCCCGHGGGWCGRRVCGAGCMLRLLLRVMQRCADSADGRSPASCAFIYPLQVEGFMVKLQQVHLNVSRDDSTRAEQRANSKRCSEKDGKAGALFRVRHTYLRPPMGRPILVDSARVRAPALLAATWAEREGLAR